MQQLVDAFHEEILGLACYVDVGQYDAFVLPTFASDPSPEAEGCPSSRSERREGMTRILTSSVAALTMIAGLVLSAAASTAATAQPDTPGPAVTVTVNRLATLSADRQTAWLTVTVSGLNTDSEPDPYGAWWLAPVTLTQDRLGSGNETVTASGWTPATPLGPNSATVSVPVVAAEPYGNGGVFKRGPATVSGVLNIDSVPIIIQSFTADVVLAPERTATKP